MFLNVKVLRLWFFSNLYKIYSNNIIKNKKNATVMLDYNSSNQSFKTKHQLNNIKASTARNSTNHNSTPAHICTTIHNIMTAMMIYYTSQKSYHQTVLHQLRISHLKPYSAPYAKNNAVKNSHRKKSNSSFRLPTRKCRNYCTKK